MRATTTNCNGWVAAARQRGRRLGLAEATEAAAMEHDQKSHVGRCRSVLIRPVPGHGEQEPEVMSAGARRRLLRHNVGGNPRERSAAK